MPAHTPHADHPLLVHRVPPSRPLIWLGMAWEDFTHHPLASLGCGVLIALMGAVVLLFNRHPYMVAGALTAFLLVGPMMTTGLCELSRRRERGQPISFELSLKALRHNRGQVLAFSNGLMLIGLVWILLSAMLLQIAIGEAGPPIADTVWGGAWSKLSPGQLLLYFGTWYVTLMNDGAERGLAGPRHSKPGRHPVEEHRKPDRLFQSSPHAQRPLSCLSGHSV